MARIVQAKASSVYTGTPTSHATGAWATATTPGNRILAIQVLPASGVPTYSFSNGIDTFTNLTNVDYADTVNTFYAVVCALSAPIVGGTTTQVTGNASNVAQDRLGVIAIEIEGLSVSGAYTSGDRARQAQASPTTGSNSTTSGNTGTLSSGKGIGIGFGVELGSAAGAPSVGTGFTDRNGLVSGDWSTAGLPFRLETKTISATTATAATFTAAGNVPHLSLFLYLKDVAFTYDPDTEQYIYAPAGPYESDSVWDSDSEEGNATIAPLEWTPSGLALTFDADGIPYIGGSYTDRQTFDYREWDVGDGALLPVVGGGTTATYVIGNETPTLGTIPTQAWVAGVDSYVDLDIADDDDILADLVITGTIDGNSITSSYNASGVRVVMHTYLSGDPGEYQKWRLEFHLAAGASADSGTVSNLKVTDPYGAEATFAAFNWTLVNGVQVPNIAGETYADGIDALTAVGLFGTEPVLTISGVTDGDIISTDPAYPAYVAPGSLISLTVSAVEVPDVVGMLSAAAIAALGAVGLVPVEVYSGNTTPDTVYDQDLPAGELALPGDTVFIYLPYSGTDLEIVPYLLGATEDSASRAINAIYCTPVVAGGGGTVQAQSEPAFSRVPRGTSITITMGGAISAHDRRRRGRPPFNSVETVNVRNRLA